MSATVLAAAAPAAAPATPLLPPPNVQLSYGPMLIGVFFNMILYGILLSQAYFYYQTYKKDARWIKILVVYLFVIETANTGIDMALMYQPLILEYGHQLTRFPVMFNAEPVTIVAISMPIQLFFAWRIYRLTKQPYISILIVLLALVSFGGGLWTTVKLIMIKLFKRKPELHTPALVWFLSATVADILITATLVVNLYRRKTGFAATDDAIGKLIRLTVQTGMITAIFAIADVIFFMTLAKTALNFIWDLALTKVYTNCLLSTLNARASLKEMASHHSGHRQITSSGLSSRRPYQEPLSPTVGSHAYELEQKSYDRSYELSTQSRHNDIEAGITVTKIVETVQEPYQSQRKGMGL